jgi:hypothetical protein
MFKLFYEGEESLEAETMDEILAELREIKQDFITDCLNERQDFPEMYVDDPFDPDAAFKDYLDDIYELVRVVPIPVGDI